MAWAERGTAGLTIQVRELRARALEESVFVAAMDAWRQRFAVVVQTADGGRRVGFVDQDWLEL